MSDVEILKINEQADAIAGCVRFDKGSGKFSLPKEFLSVFKEVKREAKGKYFHYPKVGGEKELKEEIVKLEKSFGRELSLDNVVVTHGGMSGLFAVFASLTEPGDEVITSDYCFEGFASLINHFRLVQKRGNLGKAAEIEKLITAKTKLIIINSPENPTGRVYSQSEIDSLVLLAEEKGVVVLSDEVMNRIIYAGNHWAGPTLISAKVIVVNSFAKCWLIPGIRAGWLATSSPDYVERFNKFYTINSIGVSLLSQLFLAKLLAKTNVDKFLSTYLKILATRRELVKDQLLKNKIDFLALPAGGMNFYIDLGIDSQKLAPELLARGVAIIPGRLFEGQTSTYARLGFGAVAKEDIVRGIEVISSQL